VAQKKLQPSNESNDTKLCRKWATNDILNANTLESAHQHILSSVRLPGAMENRLKASQVHFAQKIEFEQFYQRGIVKSLWDYYQTKDERMKFWRSLKGKEYTDYMEKTYNGEEPYH